MLKICEMARAVIGNKADTQFHMMVEKAVTEEQLRTQKAERRYHSRVLYFSYYIIIKPYKIKCKYIHNC